MKRLATIFSAILFIPFVGIGFAVHFLLHCAGVGFRCGKEIAEEFFE